MSLKNQKERRSGGARPGQKTFRAPPELLDALENRALAETVARGAEVGASDIIRRGIEWALAQPLPGAGRRDCLVVATVGGGRRCLECTAQFSPDGAHACPRDGKAVSA